MSENNVPVKAVIKTNNGYKFGGAIYGESNCWSMLKGGLIADTTGVAELYFEVLPIALHNFFSDTIDRVKDYKNKNKSYFEFHNFAIIY